jgi:DNA polymerase (family X)
MEIRVTKDDVVRMLDEISLYLELKGENPFKSKAYQNAARHIEQMDDFNSVVAEGNLSSIKGIGDALHGKIMELVTTGRLAYYENLKASIPPGNIEMLKIRGLGPKKIKLLHDLMGIETIGELEYACNENRLVELPGFGRKTQEKIQAGIEQLKKYKERHLFSEVIGEAGEVLSFLQAHTEVVTADIAGSLRRGSETVKDIDLLAASHKPFVVGEYFVSCASLGTVTARGETKISASLKSGINCDLRIVSPREFPYALHHFTGSKEHNTAMRGRAKTMDMKMNEYGLFKSGVNVPCGNEEEIFAALGLQYIPPELREDMGEIEAAGNNGIPDLIEHKDVRGLFHIHTSFSDGADSLEAMVKKARQMGLDYIGITDHSRSAYYAGGLSIDSIKEQHELIDRINAREAPFYIFKGIESDILPDGQLDYDEEVLERFDFVIAAVHSHFGMPLDVMTSRIIKAMSNPHTTMLAHPTGRLLLTREPYAVDIKAIIDYAAEKETVIELNANPQRLDLDWRHCQYAGKKGVRISINPDSHHAADLNHFMYGVNIARKGWLESGDCINCLSLSGIKEWLADRRRTSQRH